MDTLYLSETPEGISITLRPAGVSVRLSAFLLDLLIRMALFIALAGVLGSMGKLGQGLVMVLYFLIEWLYPVFFEIWPKHATPGKRVMGLTVVMDTGLPVTLGASVLRNLLRAVDFLPFAYALGLFTMLCRPDFKRLGDLAAGTLVVYSQTIHDPGGIPDAEPLAPARPLSLAEQEAIVAWASRSTRLTAERTEELAAHASRILPPRAWSTQLTPQLMSVAQWLMGRR
ncbi:MAG: RDD family protein [Burkholderiales bacterium]